MWKKRALLTAAMAVVVCAVMFGLMVASAEVTKELHTSAANDAGSTRRLTAAGKFVVHDGEGNVANIQVLEVEEEVTTKHFPQRRLDGDGLVQAASQIVGMRRTKVVDSRRLGLEDSTEVSSFSHATSIEQRQRDGDARRLANMSPGRSDIVRCADGSCYVIELDDDGDERRLAGSEGRTNVVHYNLCPEDPTATDTDGRRLAQPSGTSATSNYFVTVRTGNV